MPRDITSGVYTLPSNSVSPAVTRTKISSSDFNAVLDDIEVALNDLENLGKAVATTSAGVAISDSIVTTSARRIKSISQTAAASTITVEFYEPHGYTASDTICVRAGGWATATLFAHPALGDWPVTVPTATTIVLTGSTWLASTFLHGIAYKSGTLVDARPSLTTLLEYVDANGGGRINLPAGVLVLASKDTDVGPITILSVPNNVMIAGQGRASTALFVADATDGWGLQVIASHNVTLCDFTFFGNRQKQGVGGYHAIRIGSPINDVDNDSIRLERLDILGSAGYGVGWQGENAMTNCAMIDCRIVETDSDGTDWKNRDSENRNNVFTNLTFEHCALNNIGTDNVIGVTLGNNPFSTTNGSPTVTVTQDPRPHVPQIVTFSGATAVAGLTLNGSYAVASVVSATEYTITAASNANATTTGGGSAVVAKVPQVSPGDSFLDTRGPVQADTIRCVMDFWSRVGVTARAGSAVSYNGVGSHNSAFSNISVKHSGNYGNTNTTGFNVSSEDTAIGVVSIDDMSLGVQFTDSAKNCVMASASVVGADQAFRLRGENISVTAAVARSSTIGFRVEGTFLQTTDLLGANPFTTVSGSNEVTVTHTSHGLSVADDVRFSNAETFNDVEMNGDYTVLTVPDANSYTVAAAQVASASGSGGGSTVVYSYFNVTHSARDIKVIGCLADTCGTGFSVLTKAVAGTIEIAHCTDRGATTTAFSESVAGTTLLRDNTGFGSDLLVTGKTVLNSVLSPNNLTGDVDDYNPGASLATSTIVRLSGGSADRNITGVVGGSTGRILTFYNVGTTNNLVFKHDTTSTATNRFFMVGDHTLPPNTGCVFWYDGTSSRWRLLEFINSPSIVNAASASAVDLGVNDAAVIRITGTTTITSFSTETAGTIRYIRFADALTFTHNGTSLILPGGANITTAANDCCIAISLGSGNWIVTNYTRASGKAVVPPAWSEVTSKPADIQRFTGSGTWTKPSGATFVHVHAWAAGGGGGGGAKLDGTGTAISGGGGGGGGGRQCMIFEASALGATETVTIGAGGAGGTGASSAGVGADGSQGSNTTFGSLLTAYAGGAGSGGSNVSAASAGGSGGGSRIIGANASGATAGNNGGAAVGAGNGGSAAAGGNANQQGGGGAGSGGGGTAGQLGGFGPAGGGGGSRGGVTAANAAAAGGAGGGWFASAAGGASAGDAGAAGGSALTTIASGGGAGGGGGGGAGNTAGNGGDGGAGQAPGGGGGGGGATQTGTQGGNGGAGARGEVLVVTYF